MNTPATLHSGNMSLNQGMTQSEYCQHGLLIDKGITWKNTTAQRLSPLCGTCTFHLPISPFTCQWGVDLISCDGCGIQGRVPVRLLTVWYTPCSVCALLLASACSPIGLQGQQIKHLQSNGMHSEVQGTAVLPMSTHFAHISFVRTSFFSESMPRTTHIWE